MKLIAELHELKTINSVQQKRVEKNVDRFISVSVLFSTISWILSMHIFLFFPLFSAVIFLGKVLYRVNHLRMSSDLNFFPLHNESVLYFLKN